MDGKLSNSHESGRRADEIVFVVTFDNFMMVLDDGVAALVLPFRILAVCVTFRCFRKRRLNDDSEDLPSCYKRQFSLVEHRIMEYSYLLDRFVENDEE